MYVWKDGVKYRVVADESSVKYISSIGKTFVGRNACYTESPRMSMNIRDNDFFKGTVFFIPIGVVRLMSYWWWTFCFYPYLEPAVAECAAIFLLLPVYNIHKVKVGTIWCYESPSRAIYGTAPCYLDRRYSKTSLCRPFDPLTKVPGIGSRLYGFVSLIEDKPLGSKAIEDLMDLDYPRNVSRGSFRGREFHEWYRGDWAWSNYWGVGGRYPKRRKHNMYEPLHRYTKDGIVFNPNFGQDGGEWMD